MIVPRNVFRKITRDHVGSISLKVPQSLQVKRFLRDLELSTESNFARALRKALPTEDIWKYSTGRFGSRAHHAISARG